MGQAIQRIESLLYDDPDFQYLSRLVRNKERHIFDVICKEQDELTFSRTLKYFLDPRETHNSRDLFLRRFIHTAVMLGSEDETKRFSRLDIDMLDLEYAQVYREYSLGEYGQADILVEIPNELYCLVEVKLFSGEGYEQTNRYSEYMQRRVVGDYQIVLPCFLTPEGNVAESDDFIPFSFESLNTVFDDPEAMSLQNEDNKYLLSNFLRWLKDLSPMKKDIKAICRSLYSKYKKEIDLIVENAPTIAAFLKEVGDYINSVAAGRYLAHYSSDWLTVSPCDWLSDNQLRETRKYSSVRIEFNYMSENLYITFVVPNNENSLSFVKKESTRLFDRDFKEVESWRNWGKIYFRMEKFEDFIPESFVSDWDDRVRHLADILIQKCDETYSRVKADTARSLL